MEDILKIVEASSTSRKAMDEAMVKFNDYVKQVNEKYIEAVGLPDVNALGSKEALSALFQRYAPILMKYVGLPGAAGVAGESGLFSKIAGVLGGLFSGGVPGA